MTVSLDRITAIADRVVGEESRLTLATIAASDGATERVEVIVTVAGDSGEPVRVVLNLNRSDADGFEADLRRKMHELCGSGD